mmetsp:Transcript_47338/g.126671  ORF Transcript_47338/g.126671 Transcript_47338/m.126671 type:complete len:207 (+) Transcript_47338:888-1508(+)
MINMVVRASWPRSKDQSFEADSARPCREVDGPQDLRQGIWLGADDLGTMAARLPVDVASPLVPHWRQPCMHAWLAPMRHQGGGHVHGQPCSHGSQVVGTEPDSLAQVLRPIHFAAWPRAVGFEALVLAPRPGSPHDHVDHARTPGGACLVACRLKISSSLKSEAFSAWSERCSASSCRRSGSLSPRASAWLGGGVHETFWPTSADS